jgi:hypothetical protein
MAESSKILYVGLDVHKDSISVAYAPTAAPTSCAWARSGRASATSTSFFAR